MQKLRFASGPLHGLCIIGVLVGSGAGVVHAADHLDSPTVIADPAADIGDLFAWMSPDGRRVNLAMTIVAHRFSDQLQYVFHVDSGARFGETIATTSIMCRFDIAGTVECWAGDADYVRGDAGNPVGLEGQKRRFRVFAGPRDDPFFNNVKGSRAALNRAAAALQGAATMDAAGCPRFDQATSHAIFDDWRHTEGRHGEDFLKGWTPASLVISIDRDAVGGGGRLLAVWSAVHKAGPGTSRRRAAGDVAVPVRPDLSAPIERTGRAMTGNALLGLFASADVSSRLKEAYNRAAPAQWPQSVADLERGLALYDGFDGECGNQWLIERDAPSAQRYRRLARVFADDRLWIDSTATACNQYLGVELAEFTVPGSPGKDCGGRTPNHDAVDVFRSLLAVGSTSGLDDGVERDEQTHSTSEFPFLAAP